MSFLKNLFKKKSTKTGIIFIIEDNQTYSKILQNYIKTKVQGIKDVKIFPVGETCMSELDSNPDLIIVDYFLDSRYPDAETGLEAIKEIRSKKPDMNIVVLSAQQEINITIEAIQKLKCIYIKKDEQALEKVAQVIADLK
jgi:two-component system OmpR family response regulator